MVGGQESHLRIPQQFWNAQPLSLCHASVSDNMKHQLCTKGTQFQAQEQPYPFTLALFEKHPSLALLWSYLSPTG